MAVSEAQQTLVTQLLSLDQSTRVSGWAVFNGASLEDCGKFEASGEIGERLVTIKEEIISLIEEQNVTKVVFEDIQLQNNVVNNVVTYKNLAMVFGVILEYLEEENISYDIVPSSTWKSKLGIKGKTRPEQKKNAQQQVLDTYKVKASQDTCDAICIGASTFIKSGHDWST